MRHTNPISATLAGIRDQFRPSGEQVGALTGQDRLDGQTALVTGANSGLGKAIAIRLAARGARVLMACRNGIPEAGMEVRRAAAQRSIGTTPQVEMLRVDLSDLHSVDQLCDRLVERHERLDVVVLNAAVMPRQDRPSAQGLELMFAVNYLAHAAMLQRMLADGVIAQADHGDSTTEHNDSPDADHTDNTVKEGRPASKPRIIIVSSEAHRSAEPIDWDTLGQYTTYGTATGMRQYAHTKMLLVMLAQHLARTLAREDEVEVAVHALCPGAVNSNLAREAPLWAKPLLWPIMALLFRDPDAAADPALYLACSTDLEGKTGCYLHLMRAKTPAPQTLDPDNGARLWHATTALIANHMGRQGEDHHHDDEDTIG